MGQSFLLINEIRVTADVWTLSTFLSKWAYQIWRSSPSKNGTGVNWDTFTRFLLAIFAWVIEFFYNSNCSVHMDGNKRFNKKYLRSPFLSLRIVMNVMYEYNNKKTYRGWILINWVIISNRIVTFTFLSRHRASNIQYLNNSIMSFPCAFIYIYQAVFAGIVCLLSYASIVS